MAFTQAELDAAVEKIVRSSIRREYGALGNRKVEQVFNDVQDAAAGVFISQQNAVFYVVFLAAQRLLQAIETEQELIQDFIDTVTATGRRVRPIESLTPLSNAKVALDALSLATNTRSGAFADIEDVPAFQRFEKNTQRFLNTASRNVVANGEIVRTPSEARGLLGTLVSSLRSAHEDVIRRAALLEQAVDDFNQLDVGHTIAGGIIANAASVLSNVIATLQVLSAENRLTIIRTMTLDILAARSTVRGFGSLKPPTTFLPIEGTGQVFADSTHPATPAFVDSDIFGPYPILSDQLELDLTLDGDSAVTTTISLQGSFVARAEATVTETYNVGQPNSNGINNNELSISLLNYPTLGVETTIDITLTTTPTLLAGSAVSDINAAISTASGVGPRIPIRAEVYPQPFRFSGAVDINVTTSGSDADFVSVNPSVDFTALGVKEGDYVIVSEPDSVHTDSYFLVDSGGVSANTLICTRLFPAGPPPAVDELGKRIEVGGDIAIRLRITDDQDVLKLTQPTPPYVDYRLQALIDRVAIRIPPTTSTVTADPPETVQYNTTTTLGFFPNSIYYSRPTSAADVVAVYNSSFQAAVLGTPRTKAEAVFSPTLYSGRGRSVPTSFTQLFASKFQGTGDLTSTGTEVTVVVAGAATAGVVVGDVLGIIASATTVDTGLFGTITSVDDTSVTAAIIGATTTTDVDIEIGPDLSGSSTLYTTARVSSNSFINDGDYFVTAVGPFPFQLTIESPLPLPAALPGSLPHVFTLEVGRFFVRFYSTSTDLDTAITIDDGGGNPNTGVLTFFAGGSASAVGTTKYFQLPQFPAATEIGDSLELTTVQYNLPSFIGSIVSLEGSLKLIEVSPELDTDTAAFVFSQNSPVPFARVRKGRLNNYQLFRANLQAWLALDDNQTQFFTNFSAVLNPLTVNTNPTPSQVNDVRIELQSLAVALNTLTGFIGNYEADPITEVDNLIASYIQEGADRAADLLLEARFTDFFGLDQDEVSYAGTVQKSIKEVARNDLPVRKDNRVGAFRGQDQLLASYEEPDYEFDTSDIDDVSEPDFNIGQDVEFPNRGF